MITEEVLHKLNHDPSFINLKRFNYSLEKLLERYPTGVPDRIIALALNITEEEVEIIYQDIIKQLQEKIIKIE